MIRWQPSASFENLRLRAQILKSIRHFFDARNVMEVETPLLCHTSVTDPFIQSIPAIPSTDAQSAEKYYYLQTSPEYAMKRLLAAGSGPIYQMTKAFRQEEIGRWHNPEFTMLEWYRPDFNHHQLMDEMDDLLQATLKTPTAERISYRDMFERHLQLNPHQTSVTALKTCAIEHGLTVVGELTDIDAWLQLLMSHLIEPQLGKDRPCFIYDFPASQAALSKITPTNPPVASRFEVYFKGVELANGFHELQDATEQRKRFEENLTKRKQLGLPLIMIDDYLLAALSAGLPDCAGVALGVDRLVMLASNNRHIADVISFDFTIA